MPRKSKQQPAAPVMPRSSYPDLLPALEQLDKAALNAEGEKLELIQKWATQLQRIQREMTHFERIETLSGALRRVKQSA